MQRILELQVVDPMDAASVDDIVSFLRANTSPVLPTGQRFFHDFIETNNVLAIKDTSTNSVVMCSVIVLHEPLSLYEICIVYPLQNYNTELYDALTIASSVTIAVESTTHRGVFAVTSKADLHLCKPERLGYVPWQAATEVTPAFNQGQSTATFTLRPEYIARHCQQLLSMSDTNTQVLGLFEEDTRLRVCIPLVRGHHLSQALREGWSGEA